MTEKKINNIEWIDKENWRRKILGRERYENFNIQYIKIMIINNNIIIITLF